jgi:hypothetical protein
MLWLIWCSLSSRLINPPGQTVDIFFRLFHTEERCHMMLAALKWLEGHAPEGTLNAQAYAQAQFPEENPHWDPNDDQNYQWLEQYQEALLGGIKEGGKKAMNTSKTSEVLQGPDESPSQYMSICVWPSTFTPPLTWRPLKTSRCLMRVLLARVRGT